MVNTHLGLHAFLEAWPFYLFLTLYLFMSLSVCGDFLCSKSTLHMCMHAKSLQLCLTLCNHMDCSSPGSYVYGILQARILKWVAMPSSRDLSKPGTKPVSPTLQVDSLPTEPPGKPPSWGEQEPLSFIRWERKSRFPMWSTDTTRAGVMGVGKATHYCLAEMEVPDPHLVLPDPTPLGGLGCLISMSVEV